ncbi:MAG: methyltransferase domain-containing protein [Chloroflexi bacterium]|nr:methyltransferase domain-containing protein [Chloroflexota bacterium]
MRGIRPDTVGLITALDKLGVFSNARIRAAFGTVPRAMFLPNIAADEVYTDRAIITKRDTTGAAISSSSQPTMMAQMLTQLDLQPGMNVLEIGAGTGYNAAIMQALVGSEGRVTSIELDVDVANQARDNLQRAGYGSVHVVEADGAAGYSPRAAYDRIICTATAWDVPAAWVRQLKQRGRLVTPIQVHAAQVSAAFEMQRDGTLYSEHNLPCRFVLMRGAAGVPDLVRQIGSSALTLWSLDADDIDGARLHLLLTEDHDVSYLSEPLSADNFWSGLMPFTMLNAPSDVTLATYFIAEDQKAYGMEAGSGYAIFSPASAVFVPYQEKGLAHTFAGSDAFIMAQTMLDDWNSMSRPGVENLRLLLTPHGHEPLPTLEKGRTYRRVDHDLHVWLQPVGDPTHADLDEE